MMYVPMYSKIFTAIQSDFCLMYFIFLTKTFLSKLQYNDHTPQGKMYT